MLPNLIWIDFFIVKLLRLMADHLRHRTRLNSLTEISTAVSSLTPSCKSLSIWSFTSTCIRKDAAVWLKLDQSHRVQNYWILLDTIYNGSFGPLGMCWLRLIVQFLLMMMKFVCKAWILFKQQMWRRLQSRGFRHLHLSNKFLPWRADWSVLAMKKWWMQADIFFSVYIHLPYQ